MALERGIDGTDPLRAQPVSARAGVREDRHAAAPWRLGPATLACPECDAPIALGGRSVPFSEALQCPFCGHDAPLRAFVSLALPARPARVEVRLIRRARPVRS